MAFTAAAFGAAVRGLRPVVEIMFADFLGLVVDTVANQAAKYWYLSNEQASVPYTIRTTVGGGGRFGAIHSQTPIGMVHESARGKDRRTLEPGRREGAA